MHMPPFQVNKLLCLAQMTQEQYTQYYQSQQQWQQQQQVGSQPVAAYAAAGVAPYAPTYYVPQQQVMPLPSDAGNLP